VFHLTRYRYVFFAISGAIIVPGLLALLAFGLNLGIDFTGGTTVDLRFQQPSANVKVDDLTTIFKNAGATDVSTFASTDLGTTGATSVAGSQFLYITFSRPIGTNLEAEVVKRLSDAKLKLPKATKVDTEYSAPIGGKQQLGLIVFKFGTALKPADLTTVETALKNLPATDLPPSVTGTGSTAPAPAATTGPSAATVTLGPTSFNGNSSVTITAGQSVTFDNARGGTHNLVTGAGGTFSQEAGAPGQLGATGLPLTPGDVTPVTFPTAGTYHITCTFHPSMQLTVTVKAAPKATAAAGSAAATPATTATPTASSTSSGTTFPVSVKSTALGANNQTYEVNTQTDLVETPEATGNKASLTTILATLQQKYGAVYVEQKSTVGAAVAGETATKAIGAVALAAAAILAYIAIAFRHVGSFKLSFRFGASAIIALLHDAVVVLGLWAIFGKVFNFKVDTLFLTAVLTVIGFSVHDTIVVFDRIRENLSRRTSEPFVQVVDTSLIQTLSRSLNTSMTVLFVLSAEALFGGASIREFVLALLIGIASGTFSSIFNASMILAVWQTGEYRDWFGGRRRRAFRQPAQAERSTQAAGIRA
jgi:preprotein translocase SecF subunit